MYDIEMNEVRQLRIQGRFQRDLGNYQLMHAAYKSARSRVRALRTGNADAVAQCMCGKCK